MIVRLILAADSLPKDDCWAHFHCACTETATYELPVKILIWTFHLYETIFRRFLLDKVKSVIFYFPEILQYLIWPKKCVTRHAPHGDHKFPPSLMLTCPSVAYLQYFCCWYVTMSLIMTLTIDLLTLDSDHAWQVTWSTSTKFEDPMPIHSWVISYDVSYMSPLTTRWHLTTTSTTRLALWRRQWRNVLIIYIHLYLLIYMVAEIRKTATTTTERKKERNLIVAPMTNIP